MSENREGSARKVGESADNAPKKLADDQFYRALASAQRRRLLSYLLDETKCSVDELAAALAEWDESGAGSTSTPDDPDEVALQLVHAHLPLLDDVDLVSYDDGDAVRMADVDAAVAGLIDRSVAAERQSTS